MKNCYTLISMVILLLLWTPMSSSAQIYFSDALSVTDGDDSFGRKSPRLALNADGDLLVFWVRTSNEAFYISTLSEGQFSAPVQIPFGGLNPNIWFGSLGPNMAANGDHIYVTFEVYGDAIYVTHSADGGQTWDDPVAAFIPPSGRRATIPTVGVDSDGNPYLAYVNTNTAEQDAHYGMVRSTDFGQTFLPEVDVSASAEGSEVCECCNGHIEVSESGDVFIMFRNNNNNLRDSWLVRSTDGGTSFSEVYDMDETDWMVNGCPSNGPHFDIIGDEVLAAYYSGSGADGSGAYYASLDLISQEVSATMSIPLSDLTSSNQNRPRAAGSGDDMAIVWQESYDGSTEIAITASSTGIEGLGASVVRLTEMTSNQQYPDILYANGNFHVVYEDVNSGTVMYQEVSFSPLGIEEANRLSITLSPNPCSDRLTIQGMDITNGTYRIFNPLGEVLRQGTLASNSEVIALDDIPSGSYLIQVESQQALWTQVFLVE